MLGFSMPKLLLLIITIAIVWFGFRYVGRVDAIRRQVREEMKRRQAPRGPVSIQAEDLVKCVHCGAYVAARSASPCGRGDCPWRR